MTYLCPSCRERLNAEQWQCPAGHRVTVEEGVVRLIAPALAAELAAFLPVLEAYRGQIGRRLLDPAAYPELPFGRAVQGDREWEQRQYDLAGVIETLTQHWPAGGRRTALDVGAYNGWLSAQLARRGHRVTGVDVFTDPYDGLGARRHYPVDWEAVQLDVRDLALLNQQYDVVVLNRCLAFAPDPAAALRQAQARVAGGGVLLALGVQVFADPRAKAQQVAERSRHFAARYGRPMFLWDTRGYLDAEDQAALEAAGLRLRPYRQLWWPDLKARLQPTWPRHYYGVWTAPRP